MEIGRENVFASFKEYTSQYDLQDKKIKLKVDHTYRVAALCERIAGSLQLSQNDRDLAWIMGMLHDIGRFEQVRNYGTFSDADSIDHAHYGVQILYDEGKLYDYLPEDAGEKEKNLIRTAIWNHSAFRIEAGLNRREEMFCHILRDADKIDILKVNYDIPIEEIYNVTTQDLKNAVVTEEVMKQFFEGHAIIRKTKKSSVDHIAGHAALVFELVYPESIRIVKEQGYLDKILAFESDNPVTAEQFRMLRSHMEQFLSTGVQ